MAAAVASYCCWIGMSGSNFFWYTRRTYYVVCAILHQPHPALVARTLKVAHVAVGSVDNRPDQGPAQLSAVQPVLQDCCTVNHAGRGKWAAWSVNMLWLALDQGRCCTGHSAGVPQENWRHTSYAMDSVHWGFPEYGDVLRTT